MYRKLYFLVIAILCSRFLGQYSSILTIFAENYSQVYTDLAIPVAFIFLVGRLLYCQYL